MERVAEERTSARLGSAREPTGEDASSGRPARPEVEAKERWIAAAIFTATVAYLWIFRRYTSMEPDEGIVLEGRSASFAERCSTGISFIFHSWVLLFFGAAIQNFGSSFLVARTALLFFGGVYSVVAYLLARRVCLRVSAIFVARW